MFDSDQIIDTAEPQTQPSSYLASLKAKITQAKWQAPAVLSLGSPTSFSDGIGQEGLEEVEYVSTELEAHLV